MFLPGLCLPLCYFASWTSVAHLSEEGEPRFVLSDDLAGRDQGHVTQVGAPRALRWLSRRQNPYMTLEMTPFPRFFLNTVIAKNAELWTRATIFGRCLERVRQHKDGVHQAAISYARNGCIP